MPRFVLLEHDHPHVHLDLMFEVGTVLWTWQLASFPSSEAAVEARRIFDHRLLYLDYEGPISGNRGLVRRLDRGVYEWLEQTTGRLAAWAHGSRLTGRLELVQVDGERWQLSVRPQPGQGRAGGE
jgi:hypothetical protein